MQAHGLAGNVAVGRLGRDDFPNSGYAGLLGELGQEGYGYVGFDVVFAYVAGVAAVGFQEVHDAVHVAGQVDGDGYGAAGVDGESAAACSADRLPSSTAATSWFRWEPRLGYCGSCFSGTEKSSGPSPWLWARLW